MLKGVESWLKDSDRKFTESLGIFQNSDET